MFSYRQLKPDRFTVVLRSLARLGSLISLTLLLLFIIGERLSFSQLGFVEWVGLLFFPVGVMAGMILAWRWETLGGALTIISLLGFYMVVYSARGGFPEGFWFALFALPGLVFLYCGLRSSTLPRQLKSV